MKFWKDIHKKNHAVTVVLEISLCILTVVIYISHIFPLFKHKDLTAPTITLNDSTLMVIPYGSTFIDPGVSAIDDIDGDISTSVIVKGNINTLIYGKQYLTYTATDSAGNTQTIQRTVVVQEFTPPALYLSGDEELYIPLGGPLEEPGYFAIDNADGDLTASVALSDIDLHTVGTYTLSYTVRDSSGNTTIKQRTVHIFEPQSPEQAAHPPGKIVYLTFDDGPGQYTQKLLDILDKYNVNATFFVTGQYEDYHYLIGESYKQGHTIALHTYSHKFSEIYASETSYYGDLSKISAICESQTGEKPSIVRFPGGTSNTISKKYCRGIMSSLTQSLTESGYQYCDWNVDSQDAGEAQTASAVASNVIHDIQKFSSAIVLMHDTKAYSVEAVEKILYWGLTHGYTFLPLTDETPMWHHHACN